jgi:CRAL/TRIO domain
MFIFVLFQNYYPERLGKMILINVPQFFMKAWKIICPFIDENMKQKVIMFSTEIN